MPVGFLLFDGNTKGFDDVWFVEEGETREREGKARHRASTCDCPRSGQGGKKVSLCPGERTNGHLAPKPLDISLRSIDERSTVINDLAQALLRAT